jgi:hypothetical protein
VLLWLDDLITKSLDQMEASIINTFTPEAQQEASQFAKGVITNLLTGKNTGEQFLDLFNFNFKAGVAQFIGQNCACVPNLPTNIPDVIGDIHSGNTGCHNECVNQISYCPYVGLRFNQSVGNPPTSQPPSLQLIEWIANDGVWFIMNQPGVWHEFIGLQQPQFTRVFQEIGRDANYVYLKDQTDGSLELALGYDREFYHNADDQPGWRPNGQGYWKA